MIDYIGLRKIIKFPTVSRKTSAELSLILLANIVNSGVNFAANIIIARSFGHEIFGLFSVAANIAMTTLTFSEFGMNLTMVRFYKLHKDDPIRSGAVLLWNFYFKVAAILVLIVGALLAGDLVSRSFMQRGDKAFLAAIALVAGGLLGFWSYFKACFQAIDSIRKIAELTFIYAFCRLFFLGIYVGMAPSPDADLLFLNTYVLPVIVILLAGAFGRRDMPDSGKIGTDDVRKAGRALLDYSKWVALSSISFILIQKSMFFIVAYNLEISQVSLLSAGLLFTGVFSLISDSVRQILLPRIAQESVQRLKEQRRRVVSLLPVYFILSLLLIGSLSALMRSVLGEEYREALPIFWITGVSVAATTGVSFYNMFFHAIMKPKPDTLANFCTLLVSVASTLLVVRPCGIMGAALCYSLSLLAGESVKAFMLSRYLKRI